MKRVLGNFLGTAFVCFVAAFAFQGPATAKTAAQIAELAKQAAVVPDEGVYQIYQNHSWLWGKKGAGFFAAKQRQFSAWTSDRGKPGYGDGMWFIPGGGKLCYRAKWHGSWGVSGSMTCFEHREAGKVIYQRKSPDGDWYVFSTSRGKSKMKYGDYVSGKEKRIRAKL